MDIIKKISSKQLRKIVSEEGLGYCVQSYVNYKRIKNKKISKLWADGKHILDEIARALDGQNKLR